MRINLKIVFLIFIFFYACKKEQNEQLFSDLNFVVKKQILEGYLVTSIAFDSKGTAWIGTLKQGLIHCDGNKIEYFNKQNSIIDTVPIWDIAIDKNDNVWFSSNGLIKYSSNMFTKFDNSNSPIKDNNIFSICTDKNNAVWFSSNGLMKYDGINWTSYTSQNSILPSNYIQDIIVDSENNIFVAICGKYVGDTYLIKISNNNWNMINDFQPYFWGNLSVNIDNSIVASVNYGLSSSYDINRPNIIIQKNNSWTINNPSDQEGKSLGYVGFVNCDKSGNIWAALNKKIAIYNGQKWYVNNIDINTEGIFVIKTDNDNNTWLGTGNGIIIIETIKK